MRYVIETSDDGINWSLFKESGRGLVFTERFAVRNHMRLARRKNPGKQLRVARISEARAASISGGASYAPTKRPLPNPDRGLIGVGV